MSKKSLSLFVLILVFAVIASACGKNGNNNAGASASSAAPSSQAASPSASPEPSPSASSGASPSASPASASPEGEIAKADELSKVTQVLDWFAQPTHGGFYAAKQKGLYQEANLDVSIEPGGPQVSAVQIVASGKADFGLAGADTLLQAREQGIPVVALGAVLQISPSALFYHKEDTSIKDFGDLNGHKVSAVLAATYWQYLKSTYKLDKVQELQFNGQYANFINDKTAVTQGYVTNTLADLTAQGVETNYLLVADSGYRPYYTVIFATEKYVQEHPDIVRAYVGATARGWAYYKDNAPEINAELVKLNQGAKVESFNAEAEAQKPYIFGHDAEQNGVLYFTKERWEELSKQLHDIGILKKNEDVAKAFTIEYLPKA
ncbi:NitT/TauT family transport system substrate-binding protein [Cohnella sp. OV330]|uniref:ABC transporter substrate-binding protein n=1 Tax=Cohnella sp. OV330 TaxID=1855288 RepID=UPI0008F37B78|nr:ABC transporter substrate-binding protein [Cohnella sp. OV330]SFB02287.1 NitT/TauT family transport system substrate-binding protein [Cohnella sp. OV330]